MSDTNETTTTTTETTSQEGGAGGSTNQQQTGNGQQAGGAAGGEKTFTQDQVNAIVADRLARERQQRGQQRTETTTKGTEGKLTLEQVAQRQEQQTMENTFLRAVSRAGLQLSERQERILLNQFHSDKPERPGEWLTEVAADFGLGKATAQTIAASSTATNTQTDEKKTAAAAAAASSTEPNKVNHLNSGALIDVSKLTRAEVDQLGPAGVRQQLERVISAGQERDGRPPIPAVLRKKG